MNDVHFMPLMAMALVQMPLIILTPVCCWWIKTYNFNMQHRDKVKAHDKGRTKQCHSMRCVQVVLEAVWTYDGHVMIENPVTSAFWKQDFCDMIANNTPSDCTWRNMIGDLCKVGSNHLKAMKFWTAMPPDATSHMKVQCDHSHKHPPCKGHSNDGEL